MSGGTKQQFKQFTINSIQDACLALGMLISGVVVNLEKYKEYATEAELLLNMNNKLKGSPPKIVEKRF